MVCPLLPRRVLTFYLLLLWSRLSTAAHVYPSTDRRNRPFERFEYDRWQNKNKMFEWQKKNLNIQIVWGKNRTNIDSSEDKKKQLFANRIIHARTYVFLSPVRAVAVSALIRRRSDDFGSAPVVGGSPAANRIRPSCDRKDNTNLKRSARDFGDGGRRAFRFVSRATRKKKKLLISKQLLNKEIVV